MTGAAELLREDPQPLDAFQRATFQACIAGMRRFDARDAAGATIVAGDAAGESIRELRRTVAMPGRPGITFRWRAPFDRFGCPRDSWTFIGVVPEPEPEPARRRTRR